LLYGQIKKLTVVHKKETIGVRSNDSTEIIYTKKDREVHTNTYENGLMDKFRCPYIVNQTQYNGSKIFKVDNKEYCVTGFEVNNTSLPDEVYYVPEFGVIMRFRQEGDNFRRLIKIESSDKTENELALKLIDKILADTMYSPYQLRPFPTLSKADVLKLLKRK
jgi:hypothetical protein